MTPTDHPTVEAGFWFAETGARHNEPAGDGIVHEIAGVSHEGGEAIEIDFTRILDANVEAAANDLALQAQAEAIIDGERNTEYGDSRDDLARIASHWFTYLGERAGTIDAEDVAALMVLLKKGRLSSG